MEIWLAKGKKVTRPKGFEELEADYVSLGTLRGGTQEIGNEPTGHAKSGPGKIYLNSTVVLN